jgi:hypothetical protein
MFVTNKKENLLALFFMQIFFLIFIDQKPKRFQFSKTNGF